MLGASIIIYEAIGRLTGHSHVERLGLGIAVIGFSMAANFAVSSHLYRRAAETGSPALAGDAAHLRTDAFTSLGVLVALGLVAVTGVAKIDSIAALLVASAIVFTGVRLVTR